MFPDFTLVIIKEEFKVILSDSILKILLRTTILLKLAYCEIPDQKITQIFVDNLGHPDHQKTVSFPNQNLSE